MKTYKMKQSLYVVVASVLCTAVFQGTAWGDTTASSGAETIFSQTTERGSGEERVEEGDLYITRELAAADLESLEAPSEDYRSQDGRRYQLSRWDIREIPGHRETRSMEKQIVYSGVEWAEELPETISVAEEMTGMLAEGDLAASGVRVLKEEWREGFSVPVTFHSYGADQYEVGDMVISGGDALANGDLLGAQLLSMVGLSSRDYRIHTIEWAGEPYLDEAGQMCRQALAEGEKLLKDYEITYRGEVSWMTPVSYELGILYRPEERHRPPDPPAREELEPAPGPGPEAEFDESPLWYWVRSGFVITVAAGLVGIVVGTALLLICRSRQRRERERRGRLPLMKG